MAIETTPESLVAGSQATLTCLATVDEYLQTVPTLTWQFPADSSHIDLSLGMQSTSGATSSLDLSFNPLHTSHGGVYVCQATVNISRISTRSQTASETVTVQSKSLFNSRVVVCFTPSYLAVPIPQVSILDHVTPYNGTNFTLTGVVQLSDYVDTDVTVLGVWSSNSNPQETSLLQSTESPYPTDLIFQPLTTNSTGEYTLTVTVRASDDSEFILGNSGNATYNLVVTRE